MDTLAGVPNSTLAMAYVAPEEVPIAGQSERPYLNVTCNFTMGSCVLQAGQQYGLAFDSSAPEAAYLIDGGNYSPYLDGTMFRSQNTDVWAEESYGDVFFQISATSQPELITLCLPDKETLQIAWTNNTGPILIDQSTNLIDWTCIVGPLDNTSSWTGTIDESWIGYFRVRQMQ
jgi:hypothetical protein